MAKPLRRLLSLTAALSACAATTLGSAYLAQEPSGPTPAAVLPPAHIISADGPVPAGAALDISAQEPTPGQRFSYRSCTAAYSFVAPDGRSIAVTASHCGQVGDHVWAGNLDNTFTYPAQPIGTVIYSDLYEAAPRGLDVALIDITGWAEYQVPQPAAAPQVLAAELLLLPVSVCKLGRSTGQTCGNLSAQPGDSQLHDDTTEWKSYAALATVCAVSGDSGGPVWGRVDGRDALVGIVSGTTSNNEELVCPREQGELSFVPITGAHQLALEVVARPR